MDNEDGFKPGTQIDKDEALLVAEGTTGYTIDYIGDDGVAFEVVIVWEDRKLRDRIVELLNRYGVEG
jgi:hypothetical protein